MPRKKTAGEMRTKLPIERREHDNKKRINNLPIRLGPETDPVLPMHKAHKANDHVAPVPDWLNPLVAAFAAGDENAFRGRESMTEQRQAVKRDHVASTSGDVLEIQVARLQEVFPEVFVEGKIDFDKLKVALGGAAESGPGRFHFSWAGKDDAVSLLQTPSAGTLVPCPEESINFETTGNIFSVNVGPQSLQRSSVFLSVIVPVSDLKV